VDDKCEQYSRHRNSNADDKGCEVHDDLRNVVGHECTIPVVAFMLDPLKAGLVTSLARPGGNLTGITLDAGIEIWGKRLQMLKEAIPSTAKAAFLGLRDGWEGSSGQVLREVSGRLGISLVFMLPQEGTPSEIASSLRWSSNGRTQCWSAAKETFTLTAS
jgi:hypothetical protein